MNRRVVIAGLTFLMVGGACVVFMLSRTATPTARVRHILLLTLDTTRADRLGCYGHILNGISPTPHLDALANDGFFVPTATTSCPLTLPAHATILTGLEPPEHGLRENDAFRLVDRSERRFTSIAERLEDSGYETAAFVSCQVLDSLFGLDAGFATYDDIDRRSTGGELTLAERSAESTISAAMDWLDRHSTSPTFLWVHLFDPHEPRIAHATGHARVVAESSRSLYDGEIAYMDEWIGRLIDRYRKAGLYDDLLVIAVADHGEGLGEHGEATHGCFLYDSTMRVPMIWKLPRELSPAHWAPQRARTIDIVPTIESILGLKPEFRSGVDLTRSPAPEAAYGETVYPYRQFGWAASRSYRKADRKVIASGATVEFYDLATDPGELEDLGPSSAEEAESLRRLGLEHRKGLKGRLTSDPRVKATMDLAASQYFGGPSANVPSEPGEIENRRLPTARDRSAQLDGLDELRSLLDRAESRSASVPDWQRIVGLARGLEAADPNGPMTLFWVARACLKAGGSRSALEAGARSRLLGDALERFEKLLLQRPLDHRAMNQIALAHWEQWSIDGERKHLDSLVAAARIQEAKGLADGLTCALRGRAHAMLDEWDDAIACLERAVSKAPERAAFKADLERYRSHRR